MHSPDSPIRDDHDRFAAWCRTLADLGYIGAALGWDREVSMPLGAANGRARQSGLIAAMTHRELVRPEMGDVLERLRTHANLAPPMARQVALMTRRRSRALKVPEDLVRALSEVSSRSVSAWIAARPADDWDAFLPVFREVVARTREVATLLADGGEPYDALLDEYEPGAHARDLEPVFRRLRQSLGPIVAERSLDGVHPLPAKVWPQPPQMAIAREVAQLVGYDPSAGMLATSAHPFTQTLAVGDVRFSIRRTIRDPLENVMITLHETGHALYEQGLPGEYRDTPLHEAPSLGAHESQSRFWENHVGRSAAFWDHGMPILRRHLGNDLGDLTAVDFVRAANGVAPTMIRVDADEATYNLHIALRFDVELRLMRGELEADDLPAAWDALMDEMLGLRPDRIGNGVMQDVHWPDGIFGYFPTYTLGSLYAAQLAEAADTALGGLDDAVADGRFADLLAFMREKVHRHGALLPTNALMERATGAPLSADALIRHLQRGTA